MKKRSLTLGRPILMTIGLVCTLALVIYAMQYTRTDRFQRSLSLLFGEPTVGKLWLWCPDESTDISWAKSPPVKNVELIQICAVEIEPTQEKAGKNEKLSPLLTVRSEKAIRTLSANASLDHFEVDGLPFKSRKLSEFLKSRFQNQESK